jgi:hypothetical protein
MVDYMRTDELTVDAILDDRHKTYGAFMDVSAVAVGLKQIIRDQRPDLMPDQEEALSLICTKIARIVNGDPNYIDSWRDVAGYAQLVADRLEGKTR